MSLATLTKLVLDALGVQSITTMTVVKKCNIGPNLLDFANQYCGDNFFSRN